MAGCKWIPFLVAGEQSPLECADPACTDVDEDLVGTRDWGRLVPYFYLAWSCKYNNLHGVLQSCLLVRLPSGRADVAGPAVLTTSSWSYGQTIADSEGDFASPFPQVCDPGGVYQELSPSLTLTLFWLRYS